jgi:hypothetical protein
MDRNGFTAFEIFELKSIGAVLKFGVAGGDDGVFAAGPFGQHDESFNAGNASRGWTLDAANQHGSGLGVDPDDARSCCDGPAVLIPVNPASCKYGHRNKENEGGGNTSRNHDGIPPLGMGLNDVHLNARQMKRI